jgi:hypothetical protein
MFILILHQSEQITAYVCCFSFAILVGGKKWSSSSDPESSSEYGNYVTWQYSAVIYEKQSALELSAIMALKFLTFLVNMHEALGRLVLRVC